MMNENIKKVPNRKIRRLYAGDARALLDDALVDEVAYGFYAHCMSLLADLGVDPSDAAQPRSKPVVERPARWEGFVKKARHTWEITWREDFEDYETGNPIEAMAYFVTRLPRAKSPREKMLLINRLTHECHNSVRASDEDHPLATALMTGTKAKILEMFNDLAYGRRTLPGVRDG